MYIQPLNVTKIRVAFECPRLLYLVHHFGGKMMFYSPTKRKGIGTNFHVLADKCIQYALKKSDLQKLLIEFSQPINEEKIYLDIQKKIYQCVFFPYLRETKNKYPEKVQNLEYIWDGLNQLIIQWTELIIENMPYCPVEKVIKKTFIAKEYKLNYIFSLPNGEQQLIKGSLDSLIFNFKRHRLCVVEYKTYNPVDPSAQLAQVALYSYMLHQIQSIPIDAKVFCVLPEFKQYDYSWQELEKSIYQLIPHKLQQIQQWLAWQQGQSSPPPPTPHPELCHRCPQQKKCQSFFQ